MKSIENKQITGGTVWLDDAFFMNCTFTKCTVYFSGGDVGWSNTHFIECKIVFQGQAERTVKFLKQFNLLTFDPNQPAPAPVQNSNLVN